MTPGSGGTGQPDTATRILMAADAEAADLEARLRRADYDVTVAALSDGLLGRARTVSPELAVIVVEDEADIAAGGRLTGALDVPVVYAVDDWGAETVRRLVAARAAGWVPRSAGTAALRGAIELALLHHAEVIRLRSEREQHRLVVRQNVAGVYRKTVAGILLDCNRSFARIFGYESPDQLEGRPAEILYASPTDRDAFLRELSAQGTVTNYELPMRRKDGTPIWVLENAALTTDPETGDAVVVGTLIDITDRKTLEIRLEHQANQDPLTGLANRRALETRAEQTLELAIRRHEVGALLLVDVIRFKDINDTLGHRAGDQLLVELAHRLETTLRASDTAARVGGDEFVVLLSDVDGRAGARTAGHRILRRFDEPVRVDEGEVRLRLRIGIALFPNHAESLEELMRHAGLVVAGLKSETESTVALHAPG